MNATKDQDGPEPKACEIERELFTFVKVRWDPSGMERSFNRKCHYIQSECKANQ